MDVVFFLFSASAVGRGQQNFQDPPLGEWASNFWSSMGEGFNSEKDNVCQSLALTLASISCMFSSQSCSGEETKTIPSWDEPGE